MPSICSWLNPCSPDFDSIKDFKENLSCTQQIGIGVITASLACTLILIPVAIAVFRCLVGRCIDKPVPTPTMDKTQAVMKETITEKSKPVVEGPKSINLTPTSVDVLSTSIDALSSVSSDIQAPHVTTDLSSVASESPKNPLLMIHAPTASSVSPNDKGTLPEAQPTPVVSLSEAIKLFDERTTTIDFNKFSILTLNTDAVSPTRLQNVVDVIVSDCLSVLQKDRFNNNCTSDARDLSVLITKRQLSTQLLFIFCEENDDFRAAKEFERNFSAWSIDKTRYDSPVGDAHHTIVYSIIDNLHVAIDVNFSRRVKGAVKGQLMIASSQERLADLVGNRYLASTIRLTSIDGSVGDAYAPSAPVFYRRS